MIHYNNSNYVINHDHYRNPDKERFYTDRNSELFNNEKKTDDSSNGLSNLEYQVLSSFEMAPRFTIVNVDFKLK